ncbi:hypothetical protein AVEN_23157-1 [Araneus ventricosus]|uniref:Uncharacterized protein n=1 Tax=Araneus ventricosus TaxID=182803 RepID=A0A4Y2FER8_ARAVE|nr:hypothetical protein AVEN_23157-1 [Araneus ventricosus]
MSENQSESDKRLVGEGKINILLVRFLSMGGSGVKETLLQSPIPQTEYPGETQSGNHKVFKLLLDNTACVLTLISNGRSVRIKADAEHESHVHRFDAFETGESPKFWLIQLLHGARDVIGQGGFYLQAVKVAVVS